MDRIKELVGKLLVNDVLVRSVKTFVQAFIAVWLIAEQPFSTEVISAAVAAAVSAVWNSWLNR